MKVEIRHRTRCTAAGRVRPNTQRFGGILGYRTKGPHRYSWGYRVEEGYIYYREERDEQGRDRGICIRAGKISRFGQRDVCYHGLVQNVRRRPTAFSHDHVPTGPTEPPQ